MNSLNYKDRLKETLNTVDEEGFSVTMIDSDESLDDDKFTQEKSKMK